jgi:hypothetical protein
LYLLLQVVKEEKPASPHIILSVPRILH